MPSPGNGIRQGNRGAEVLIYEARMKALHFDPGPVDDVFDQDTRYAVTTVQKYFGLPRTGVINAAVQLVLTHFVPADDSTLTDAMWLEGVRKHFASQVILGQDLLEI